MYSTKGNHKQTVTGSISPEEYVEEAMKLAKYYHSGQKRRGADGMVPYYDEHVLGVYNIIRQECHISEPDILAIALLHDTVEDTDCTFDEIERKFGTEIMENVKLLTRIDGEPFSDYADRLFSRGSYKTVVIKLADRLNNIRNILFMPNRKWIRKKVNQTYTDILGPLPEALNRINPIYNKEIEELAEKIEKQLLVVEEELD